MSHPTTTLAEPYDGRDIPIDVDLAPLISAIWDHEITTGACCQDIGSGYASITFPTVWNMLEFLRVAVPHVDAEQCGQLDTAEVEGEHAAAALPYPLRATSWLVFAPSADPRHTPESSRWRHAINPFPYPHSEEGEWDAICTVEIPRSDLDAVTAAVRRGVDGG